MARPSTRRTRLFTGLLWVAIGAAYLYPQFLFDIHNPNERVRIYMTAAMVEEGSFVIGTRTPKERGRGFVDKGVVYERWGYVNDKALVCDDPALSPPDCAGRLYSAKAPGSSFLAYPFYAATYAMVKAATGAPPAMETIILVLRLFTVILPSLFMLLLFRRFARDQDFDPVLSDLMTVGVALGSMVYTYSHMFAGHQISGYCLFFAFLAAWKMGTDARLRWPIIAGLGSAMAVFVEYPMALVSLVIFIYAMRNRFTWKSFAAFCAGCLLPAILMGWFHTSAFGGPHKTAYATLENPQFVKDIAPGFMGLRQPKLENLFGAFVSPFEGLFFFAPWMVLLLVAPWTYLISHFRHDSRPFRRHFCANLAAVVALCVFISCHSLWRGGWTLGPRYIVPIVPFAGLLILQASSRLAHGRKALFVRVIVASLVLLSVVVTGACSLVSQGFHTTFFNPLVEVALPLLREGYITLNLGHLLGLQGLGTLWPLLALLIPGLVGLAWQATHQSEGTSPVGHRVLWLTLIIFLATVGLKGLTIPEKPMTLRKVQALDWARDHFYPYASVTNEHLSNRRHLSFAARHFPGHDGIQAITMSQQTLTGNCKGAVSTSAKYEDASRARIANHALFTALTLLQPMPTGLPVPIFLRPDHDIPLHLWRKLAVPDR
jgi:hypothetical protein